MIMKKINLTISLCIITIFIAAQDIKPVKNIIVMIPDGTSIDVVTAARWYKMYNKMGERLHIDPYITGTVTTHSSNAPIGNSAPTGSTYATGVLQQAGNLSIYPEADTVKDIYPVDGNRTYQPAVTIVEALKKEKRKAVGLVVTCEFPHATPAAFTSHHYNRGKYEVIAPQIAYQDLDVMFGGGTGILTDDIRQHFKNTSTILIEDDRNALLNYNKKNKVWALFGKKTVPYHIDRNPIEHPSLAELTEKALDLLSKKENGFFLMVEGSQIDWAAHSNDAIATITEFIAFDEAVAKAIDFAKKDGNTAVVIMPDHGTSGFSIGKKDLKNHDRLSLRELFETVSNYKLSGMGLESILINTAPEKIKEIFKQYTNIELTDNEFEILLASKNYKEENYVEVANSNNMAKNIIDIMNSRTCFGFTTGGHTGEEVFLASYHPDGDILKGNVRNVDVNKYLTKVSGMEKTLQEISDELFTKHTDIFIDNTYTINKEHTNIPTLIVTSKNKKMELKAFSSVGKINEIQFEIGSVIVYIDKNDTFYLPKALLNKF